MPVNLVSHPVLVDTVCPTSLIYFVHIENTIGQTLLDIQ